MVEVWGYGIISNISLDWIGYYPGIWAKLKYQPPEGHIYVQGCPGRYGITYSLFQKCFTINRQCLACMVEVWGIALPVTSALIGSDITQKIVPRLKYQPPEGHIYVEGCPGRYGIT